MSVVREDIRRAISVLDAEKKGLQVIEQYEPLYFVQVADGQYSVGGRVTVAQPLSKQVCLEPVEWPLVGCWILIRRVFGS